MHHPLVLRIRRPDEGVVPDVHLRVSWALQGQLDDILMTVSLDQAPGLPAAYNVHGTYHGDINARQQL